MLFFDYRSLFMNKFFILSFFLIISFFSFSQDLSSDYTNIKYLPRTIKAEIFEKYVLNNINNEEDKNYILRFYYKGAGKFYYYLNVNKTRAQFLKLFNLIYSYEGGKKVLEYEKERVIYDNEHPVFLQKGGMLRQMSHSFYFRTDDEWTGFSTVFLGYRFGVTDYFNIAVEGGAGLPQVYIASIILHFKIFESNNKLFFIGLRGRMGYKFQNAEKFMFAVDKDGNDTGYLGFGKNYLTIQNRHSFYIAPDLTIAFRFGRTRNNCLYYTIFPKVDFNLAEASRPYVFFCPVMIGYEARFGQDSGWSFAAEAGYTFPLPWGSVPDGEWVNFPSLANVSVNYRFGDKNYPKLKQNK
jgi:hypothetical protein